VADHAADVDAVGRGDEAIRLVQGLRDRLVPEGFVNVRRGGKESGEIGRGVPTGRAGFVPLGLRTADAVSDVQRGSLL
jgi:hypothetical protein